MSFRLRRFNPKAISKRMAKRHGFSLMEMITVLMIIGLLTAAVTVGTRRVMANGQRITAESDIANIVNGLDVFYAEQGRFPTQAEGLEVLVNPIGDDVDPILKKKGALKDPWGNPYLYMITGNKKNPFEVISNGPDGNEGTADDLSSLEVEE